MQVAGHQGLRSVIPKPTATSIRDLAEEVRNMSFLRHGEIYRPISSCRSKPEPGLDFPRRSSVR